MPPGPRLVVMVALAFISGAQSSTNNQQQRENNILYNHIERSKLLSKRDESAKYETTSLFLSNINPWLSACDLAQPKTAPGLQGSCSAGSLPRSRINEGPGPPYFKCRQECGHENTNNNNKNYENKINNNEYQNVNDRYNQNTLKTSTDNKQQQLSKNYNNNFSHSKSNNNYIKRSNNDMNRSNDENRQCLDYLGGDNDANSPSKICESLSDIETKLKSLRLRHCCERDVASALHNEAFEEVLKDKKTCMMRLKELIEVDKLAERITCEFHEILVRYDCDHRYSLIHDCRDCRESYRRWVCSTFIPFFATQSEIKSDPLPDKEAMDAAATTMTTDESQSMTGKAINIDSKAQKVFMKERTFEDSNAIKRSRRKAERIEQKRIRIRPCLSVCQTVEQICPYMLPADRAPAIPTQYAGEPTFLCLDPNIDETGNQLYKSSHGPSECCYNYCTNGNGLCSSTCDAIINRNNETANIASSTTTTSSLAVDDYDEVDNEEGGESTTSKQRTSHKRNVTSLIPPSGSRLYVKLDNGTYVLNDYSSAPRMPVMSQCPVNQTDSNATQSTQKCVISQSQIASTAARYTSSSSISMLVLLLLLTTSNNLLHHLNLVCSVVWNLETLKDLLTIITGS